MIQQLKAVVLWPIAPVRWRGVCIAFPALVVYMLLKGTNWGFGPLGAGVINALAQLAAAVATVGVIGYIRWYSKRNRDAAATIGMIGYHRWWSKRRREGYPDENEEK